MRYKIYQNGKLIHTYNERHTSKWVQEHSLNPVDFLYLWKHIQNEYGYLWTEINNTMYEVIAIDEF